MSTYPLLEKAAEGLSDSNFDEVHNELMPLLHNLLIESHEILGAAETPFECIRTSARLIAFESICNVFQLAPEDLGADLELYMEIRSKIVATLRSEGTGWEDVLQIVETKLGKSFH